mmetsp:Transcript_79799/g.225899  ORF Transcript_79799/g.225899 Transcript_79799/m.225899 type:complete len:506 (+) Transcript_79799:92-1609(+)
MAEGGGGFLSSSASSSDAHTRLLLPRLRAGLEDDPAHTLGRGKHAWQNRRAVEHARGGALLHAARVAHPPAAVGRHVHPVVLVDLVLEHRGAVGLRLALGVVVQAVDVRAGDALELDDGPSRGGGLRLPPSGRHDPREEDADASLDLPVVRRLVPAIDVLGERARPDGGADQVAPRDALVLARGGARPPAPVRRDVQPLLLIRPALVHRRLRGRALLLPRHVVVAVRLQAPQLHVLGAPPGVRPPVDGPDCALGARHCDALDALPASVADARVPLVDLAGVRAGLDEGAVQQPVVAPRVHVVLVADPPLLAGGHIQPVVLVPLVLEHRRRSRRTHVHEIVKAVRPLVCAFDTDDRGLRNEDPHPLPLHGDALREPEPQGGTRGPAILSARLPALPEVRQHAGLHGVAPGQPLLPLRPPGVHGLVAADYPVPGHLHVEPLVAVLLLLEAGRPLRAALLRHVLVGAVHARLALGAPGLDDRRAQRDGARGLPLHRGRRELRHLRRRQ